MSKDAFLEQLFRSLFKLTNVKLAFDATYANRFIEHEMKA